MANSTAELLDRVFEPLGEALNREAAMRIVALRADDVVQQRVDDLAERANEGTLTVEERDEYESLIAATSMLAILQAKARKTLTDPSAA